MSPEFRQRIGTVEISLSAFEDAYGWWAKRWEHCVRVRVEFVDEVTTFLTPAEYLALPKAQKDLICIAPSSAPPDILEPPL